MMLLSRCIVLAAFGLVLAATPSFASEARLKVVASFSILGDLVARVGGDRIAVSAIVGPDADAHAYSATPADAKAIAEARLIVVNGLGFEGWLDRLVKSSGAKGTVVTATAGIKPLELKGGHSHGGHSHANVDPHAWQDVTLVKTYVANIRDGLIGVDPAGRAVYEAQAAAYLAELDALDAEIKAAVGRIPPAERKVITSHDAFGYFARAYGVGFISPRGVSTEGEASAKDVAAVIRQAKAQKIKAVFMENITNPKLAEQIAREAGATVGARLYSDALSAPSGPAGTYIGLMRHNIRELTKALGGGAA